MRERGPIISVRSGGTTGAQHRADDERRRQWQVCSRTSNSTSLTSGTAQDRRLIVRERGPGP